jgi:hypothetical protein
MGQIQAIIGFFQAHWLDICTIITSTIGIASIIVKLTPNTKDDAILAKIVAFIGKYIALNPTPKM